MDLITRKKVLKMFNINVWTIRLREKSYRFPQPIHVSPEILMYDKKAVEDWLEANVANG